MKVLINARPLAPPLTGIGHYTAQLTRYLLADHQVAEVLGTHGGRWLTQMELSARLASCYQPVVAQRQVAWGAGWVSRVAGLPLARQGYWALVALRAWLKRNQLPPHTVYWESGNVLLPLNARSVFTVYDLSHLAYPQFHPADRVALLERQLRRAVARADRLVAISEFTRQALVEHFNVPADQVSVVPPGVGEEFYQPWAAAGLAAVRARYNLPAQFVLFVGTREPRKNLDGLLDAFMALPAVQRQAYPLVVAGGDGWLSSGLDARLQQLVDAGELICTGYVAQADLPALYRLATVMAYVSFYEGFGMPVAEAMVCGTPVLTSDCSAMPEVAAGAAVLVDPANSTLISEKLSALLANADLRQQLVQRGLAQAERFRWAHSGEKMKQVLLSVACD